MALVSLLLLIVSYQLVFVMLQALTFRIFSVPVVAIAVGAPPLVRWKLGDAKISLGPLINIAYVQPRDLKEIPRFKRLCCVAVPWLLLALCAVASLGLDRGLHQLLGTPRQIWRGTLQPSHAKELFSAFWSLLAAEPWAAAMVGLCKLVIFNLLPLPSLAGDKILADLLGVELVGSSEGAANRAWRAFYFVRMLGLFAFGAIWVWAFFASFGR